MRKIKNIYTILILIPVFTFVSCKKGNKIKYLNKYKNKWYSLNGNLKINDDKTFEYNRFTCVSLLTSKGNWRVIDDTLVLNSIKPKGCFFEEEFILRPEDSLNYTYKKTLENCEPNSGYVNFKNEKFFIKDSMLIYKDSLQTNKNSLSKIYNFKRTNYFQVK